MDRYHVPVETIAVFTGGSDQPRPCEYQHRVIDTQVHFRYRAYHIFDDSEADLLAGNNVFGLIVLACQKALQEGKVADTELAKNRLTIARALLKHNYDHDRIIKFLVFLKNFLYINDLEINRIFDEQIVQLTEGSVNMGIIEIVRQHEVESAREQGIQQGIQRGVQQGGKKKALAIAREMKKDGMPTQQIAKFTKLTIKEIEAL